MRTATGLTVIAVGAILAFAVSGHPSFLNIQVAGWVIMLTGVAGMLIPRRGYGWLRKRITVRRQPRGRAVEVGERRNPTYVMLNPGSWDAGEDDGAVRDSPTVPGPRPRPGPARGKGPSSSPPAEETVEEYIED